MSITWGWHPGCIAFWGEWHGQQCAIESTTQISSHLGFTSTDVLRDICLGCTEDTGFIFWKYTLIFERLRAPHDIYTYQCLMDLVTYDDVFYMLCKCLIQMWSNVWVAQHAIHAFFIFFASLKAHTYANYAWKIYLHMLMVLLCCLCLLVWCLSITQMPI